MADESGARPDPEGALVEARVEDGVGRLVLHRPAALNALSLEMVQDLLKALDRWREEPLNAVVITSGNSRAFCAGGDIRAVRQNVIDGRPELNAAFFAAEYTLNRVLATYTHPLISLIDGVCMGGGMGLAIHVPFRVVTERAVMAMPETAIGFFPDVGASHFLPRLPGSIGMYLGLTGARVNAEDAVFCGLATHKVVSDQLPRLPATLSRRGAASIEQTLRGLSGRLDEVGPLASHRAEIDWCFGAPTLDGVRERLAESGSPWARGQLDVLEGMSPQSLQITFDLILRGRRRTLDDCLRAEFEAAERVTMSHDFLEGVRAVLVDKDHRPRWARRVGQSPPHPHAVPPRGAASRVHVVGSHP